MALAAALSVASMVVGLLAAAVLPKVPPSFAILAVASTVYAGAGLLTVSRRHVHSA